MIGSRGRRGFTLIELMITIAIIGVILAIAAPAYKRYELYALTRTCFANQKTISGALQNFNLDHNEKRTDIPGIFSTLCANGYLQAMPLDPGGGGSASTANYQYTAAGFGIRCAQHGMLQ